MNKNQAGGHNTSQGGNKPGSSGEDKARQNQNQQQNQQSGSGRSQDTGNAQSNQGPRPDKANDANHGSEAGSQEPKGNQGGK